MDLLAHLFGGGLQASYPVDHDFWYGPVSGVMSQAGLKVDPEGARKISAWYRGRDLLATSLAMLPLHVYERLAGNAGADVARDHPLYDVIHRKPNTLMDSFGWRRQAMYHLIDEGNAYGFIVAGGRGFADSLDPIDDPKRVRPEKVGTGRRVYHVRDKTTGRTSTYSQDDIFHLMGPSDDGVVGKGVLEYARDSIGTALATESYAARVFSRGGLHSGMISVPGVLNEEASKRMAKSFITAVGDWHLPKILEQGATWANQSMTPENAQMLLSRKFSIDDIARWLGVPPHMIGSLDRSTNNNIEHQGQEFVTYSLGPWLSLWEFAINDQLILAPKRFYAEFVRDALVRGDIAARWQAYQIAVSTGTFTRNEVRRKENMNSLDGLDTPIDPAHLTGKQPQGEARREPPARDEDDSASARLARAEAIATESAARVLRKEIKAVQRLAVKHAANQDAFAAAVTEFYAAHVALVAETLMLPDASGYCAGQAAQIVNGDWVAAIRQWETPEYAAGLAALALEEAA